MPYKDRKEQLEYLKQYRKEWYRKNRKKQQENSKRWKKIRQEWFKNYKKNVVCNHCGESHIACIDFHHNEENSKEDTINGMVKRGLSISNLKKEIEKCTPLCSNCHRKLHYKRAHGLVV